MTKHNKKEPKTVDIPNFFNLSPRTLLQINATVIAGLFILLTIQLANSQGELVQEIRKLDLEEKLLNKTLAESDNENLNARISERLNQIEIERESAHAELIVETEIPYVIYTTINPLASLGFGVVFFVASSVIILIRAITKQMPENYHAKYPMRLTVIGFVFIGAYFFYQVFPLGRFFTGQFT